MRHPSPGKCIFACLLALACWLCVGRVAKIWRWYREPPARWLGVDACPLCYGVDACDALAPLELACEPSLASVLALVGDKNVLFGCSRTAGDVVVKRLGHDAELARLDAAVCRTPVGCDFDAVHDLHALLTGLMRRRLAARGVDTGLVLCPTTDGLDDLLSTYLTGDEDHSSPLNRILLVNAWTTFNVNSEPIVLKYIQNTTTGQWPVPHLIGACGRTVAYEYAGRMLRDYLSEPWSARAAIAVKLLKAADAFTFDHPRFGFYLTDISSENIVISSTADWNVSFVDWEHVVLVDRDPATKDRPAEWSNNHTSRVIECPGCFAFSTEDICRHRLSDHNHYSICKLILEEVLPDTVPPYASEISPNLNGLLHACHNLPDENSNRFEIASTIIAELQKILSTKN